MFSHPGKTIKIIAKILFVVGSIAIAIWGPVALFLGGKALSTNDNAIAFYFLGFIKIFLCIFALYVSSLLMYGFGTAVDNTETIKLTMNPEAFKRCDFCGKLKSDVRSTYYDDGNGNETTQNICDACRSKMSKKGYTVWTED